MQQRNTPFISRISSRSYLLWKTFSVILLICWDRGWYICVAHWTWVHDKWKPVLSHWHLIINLAQQRRKLWLPLLPSGIKSLLVPVVGTRPPGPQTCLPEQSPPSPVLQHIIWQRFGKWLMGSPQQQKQRLWAVRACRLRAAEQPGDTGQGPGRVLLPGPVPPWPGDTTSMAGVWPVEVNLLDLTSDCWLLRCIHNSP